MPAACLDVMQYLLKNIVITCSNQTWSVDIRMVVVVFNKAFRLIQPDISFFRLAVENSFCVLLTSYFVDVVLVQRARNT